MPALQKLNQSLGESQPKSKISSSVSSFEKFCIISMYE
jgi:hypothetical protein